MPSVTEPLGEKAASPKKPAAGRVDHANSPGPREGERVCTACGRCFGLGTLFCPDDGTPLETKGQKTADPYLGQVILDHIEIQKLAGVGAMGRVYRAFQRGLDRDVAVKVLHRELSSNKELVGRFIREAKLASRIVHPNVVQVHLAGQLPDGALYIVMEYLDGLSLQSAMAASANGALPLERSLHVALQLCQAVGEAHELGIVHRDLKPENVMLVRRGDDKDFAKVLDFGIARTSQAEHASMATAQGLIFGTARYISPEGARGEGATPASDVYSLAILFYQLLSGFTPFDAEQAIGLLLQHIHETPPPLTAPAGQPPIPAALAKVIVDNLAKLPADRAQSAKRFGERLRKAARDSGMILPELESISKRTPADRVHDGDMPVAGGASLGDSPTHATDVWNPPGTAAHETGSMQRTPEPRRVGGTEIADAPRSAHGGTLRLDTPPPAMVAMVANEVLRTGHDRTLPVLSRPPELARLDAKRDSRQGHNAARNRTPPRSRGGLWLLAIPLFLGIGLLLGGFYKPDPQVVVRVDPQLASVAPTAPASGVEARAAARSADGTSALPESELSGLLPERKNPPPASGPRPSGPPSASAQAAAKPGTVRVTVGRQAATPTLNQPLEFTAVVFDGPERAGNRVDAANFSFRGEGMNSTLAAALDGQGIFRVQLTFYKPGTYDVIFGGLLGGRSIGGSHRFTIGSDRPTPGPQASTAPALPGPNAAPAAPAAPAPTPKPSSSPQWL